MCGLQVKNVSNKKSFFGEPGSQYDSWLMRFLVSPGTRTRARGYYMRFVLAGWLRRFLTVAVLFLIVRSGIVPLSLFVWVGIRAGNADAYWVIPVIAVLFYVMYWIVARPIRHFVSMARCRWALFRGYRPRHIVCALPAEYDSLPLHPRDEAANQAVIGGSRNDLCRRIESVKLRRSSAVAPIPEENEQPKPDPRMKWNDHTSVAKPFTDDEVEGREN